MVAIPTPQDSGLSEHEEGHRHARLSADKQSYVPGLPGQSSQSAVAKLSLTPE